MESSLDSADKGPINTHPLRDRFHWANQSPAGDALERHPVLASDQLCRLGLAGSPVGADVDERHERDARRRAPMLLGEPREPHATARVYRFDVAQLG